MKIITGSICLIDTSVFCNLVNVPGRNQQRNEVMTCSKKLVSAGSRMLLPMASILETGNHIAQLSDGGRRRQVASWFSEQVGGALDGNAPWRPTPFFDPIEIRNWLMKFPDQAVRGVGFGDLSIIQEWWRQKELHPNRRVFVWSYDEHMNAYDSAS